MTREHKLALIFGFALVLVVGLLISDNFSASRKSEPGGPQTAEAQPPMFKDDVLVADGNTAKPEVSPVSNLTPGTITDPTSNATQLASNDPAMAPGVTPVTMGTKDPANTFGNRVGDAWNSTIEGLGNGHTTLPEAAGTEPVSQPLTYPAADPRVALQTPTNPGTLFADPVPQPTTLRDNGLGGPGEDTTKLGVKPENLPGNTEKPVVESKPEPSTSKDAVHRIAEGESFWKIAKQHYNDPSLADALKTYNKARIGKNGQLRTGASLLIPEKSVLKSGGTATASAKAPEVKKSDLKVPSKADLEKLDKTAKAEPKPETAKKSGTTTYVVKEGDTLGKIAKKLLGSSKRWTDILEANSSTLDSEDDVQVGQTLKIPAR